MIKSFKHKGLKIFFESGNPLKINPQHQKRIRLILSILNAAKELKDINFPGSGFHQLKGDLKGFWSVTVSGNWRIIFRFNDSEVSDIDYKDYH
ncbi:MAG: type II toxin-antitoxin system RelE/ParE family toxin [Spirochaetota bacterium]